MSDRDEFFVPSIKKSASPDEVPLDEVDNKSVLSEVVIEMDEEEEEKVNFDDSPIQGPVGPENKTEEEKKEEPKEESKEENKEEQKEESKEEPKEGDAETPAEDTEEELPTSKILADVTGEHISYLGSVCTMMLGLMCGCNPFMLLCNYFMFHVKTKNSKTKKYVNRITYCSFIAGLIGLLLWIGLLIGFTIVVLKKNDIMN
jgi:hypothetical protein